MVPPDPALLPAPPHLQTVPARRAGHPPVQERGAEEEVGVGGRGGGGGLDDEGRGGQEGRVGGGGGEEGEGRGHGVGVLEEAGGVGRGDCWVGGGCGAEEYGAHALRVGEWGDDGRAGYVILSTSRHFKRPRGPECLQNAIDFHGMDAELFHRSLAILVKRGKAQVFGSEDQQGVKFF